MTQTSDEEAKALQRDVQRLLGRCIVRLQQYERLLKAMIADHKFSGAVRDLEAIRTARVDNVARKTLGMLVGEFTGSFLVSGESEAGQETADGGPDDDSTFSFRIRMGLSEEVFAKTEAELEELVKLRNSLVHHFIDQHDLWSVEGCQNAQAALIADYHRIDQCYSRLREWAGDFDRLRGQVAEFHHSETFRLLVVHGIMPDGTVDWPASSLVSSFREAARALAGSEGQWVSVEESIRWIVEKYPDQTPERFGCKTWKQALQESKLFDLQHVQKKGRRLICCKLKATAKIVDAPAQTWEFNGTGAFIKGA